MAPRRIARSSGRQPDCGGAHADGQRRKRDRGGKRLIEQHGCLDCLDCHTTDGRDQIGPTWKSLYGSPVTLAGGQVVVADAGYLWAAVRDPNAQIVEGYLADIMLPLQLTDAEITSIVEFIKSLE